MRLHEYQQKAMRTMSPKEPLVLDARIQQLLHCSLGITGELAEIISSTDRHNSIEEIGDMMWYIAGAAHALGMDLEDIDLGYRVSEEPLNDLTKHSGIIADKVKRHLYYKVELDTDAIEQSISACIVALEEVANENGVTIEECCITNIDKLTVRYPDKFNEKHAVERNTHKELKSIREL